MNQYVELVESYDKDHEAMKAFIAKIKKDCQPYMKWLEKNKTHFCRGMKGKEMMGVRSVRKDREPKDTHQVFDRLLNLALKEAGVIPRSEGVFCTTDPLALSEYGPSYYIFPKGKFDFYYIDGIKDITMDLKIGRGREIFQTFPSDFMKLFNERLMKAKTVEDFDDKWNDILMDYGDKDEGFLYSYDEELEVLKGMIRKTENITQYIVKDKLPPSSRMEIVLNTKEYYYIKFTDYAMHRTMNLNEYDAFNFWRE